MRIHVSHETRYAFAAPARAVIQILRLTPRNTQSQFVRRWRIDIDRDALLRRGEDCFGNLTHTVSLDGPVEDLVVRVDGEVETTDTGGVIAGAAERFPPALFLRETALTEPDEAIVAYADAVAAEAGPSPLDRLHALTAGIHARIAFDIGGTHSGTRATEAFALGHGVCQDHAHVFLAAARHLGLPARYVSGYFHRADGQSEQEAGHAWVEAFVPALGWVGFDPANGISPTDQHIRLAAGLDYLDAAPIRGTRYGGGEETLDVRVHVDEARRQTQN